MKLSAAILFAALTISLLLGADAQTPSPPAPHFEERITEKEIAAVKAELIRRGYLRTKSGGGLDLPARNAIRAYQADNELDETGRVDRRTYDHLRTISPKMPAASRPTVRQAGNVGTQERTQVQQQGTMSKIGDGVKETTAGVGRLAGDAAKVAGSGARAGLERTWEAGGVAASKSKDAAEETGKATARGVKGAGRATQNAFRRRDDEVHAEVFEMLNAKPATRGWQFDVKEGMVTIKVPRRHNADVGAVVSELRKIVGVRSVFVVAL